MDAFIAIHTPGFSASFWTQQEVGFAVGRGVKIISLRMGEDPTGFISKHQALARRQRTAEEIALGEISTGAQNDLLRATDIARAMVTEWGMSDALGAINYDGHKRSKFLEMQIGPERGAYAEDTGRLIDSEVKRIMTDAHDEARAILTAKRDFLETVTRRLLEVEVMEGDQLRQLMGISPQPPAITTETIPLPTDELR